jgi:acetyltransferase-like isoleucine patch superfamily enzyme
MIHRLKNYLKKLPLFEPRASNTEPSPRIGINTETHDCEISPLSSVGKNCYLYKTSLGAFTYLSQNVNVMNTTIGKFCSIGQGVCISTGMHPSATFVSTHPAFFSLHKQSGATFAKESHFREMGHTTIGNDVWIGTNAIIMDDLIIGDGAIIGAGAIVTKDVQPYSIVVGNPAKHLRFRFEEDEINFLLEYKWWDKDLAWIEENYIRFHDIKSFVKDNSGNR